VRRAVSYLRWNEGDVDDIAPSLFQGRGGRPKPEVPPAEPDTTMQAAASGAIATHESQLAAAPAVPVGMPGSPQYVRP